MQVNSHAFRGHDASTGEEIAPDFPVSTAADVEQACTAAKQAFADYRATSSEERAAFLEAIGDEIMALGDDLLDRASKESGLPLARITGERGRTVNQLRLFAQVVRSDRWRGVRIDPAMPDRTPLPRADLRLRMVPLGPVAVFGASNFPLAFSTAGGDTASALAAGCPVVVKGHPAHPGTDAMVADAIRKAAQACGMPSGVFGHLQGPGNELGSALVRNPNIAAVGFTGSRSGGLAMLKIAQERTVPIPVFAEMSSVNPVILMEQALASRGKELGEAFVGSLTMGAGQFCTNPGLVLAVEGEGLSAFESAACAAMADQPAQTMLTSGIREAYAHGKEALAAKPSVEKLATGKAGDGSTCEAPELFAVSGSAVLADSSLLHEVFGAASLIVRCADIEELKAILRGLEGQLTATLQMDDGDRETAGDLLAILEQVCGRILANGWPTGVEVSHAMVHGGPYPATSDGRTTSVGTMAIERFLRPVCYQDIPAELLPAELRDNAKVPKLLDGEPA
ncbi:aldehyde dehydrogenase (NADP(+)) [Aurantiacibacter suaedae]|uniref:aldehyde dehydrogenase (NADP(+)) n=1 Tax=Aurantiacibacter suaedae TaxID=2545755 RepID=UPI0010F4ACA9|nr:aldehyde dehydrogenase (NADP(+)) [Aurantiacibacter suaedae]